MEVLEVPADRVVLEDHKAATKVAQKEVALVVRKVAVKTDHKTADRADPAEDKAAALVDRKEAVKADHKAMDRADPTEDK